MVKYNIIIKKRLIIIILALASFLMTSCSNMRFAFKNRKLYSSVTTSKGLAIMRDTFDFVMKEDRILVETMVDGTTDTVFLDTGFNGALVEIHPMSEKTDDYSKVKLGGAIKKVKVYEKVDTVRYNFLWHHLGIKMDICTDLDIVCGKSLSDYKIIGLKAVLPDDVSDRMNLNFSDQQITYYKYNDDTTYNLTGYKPIKCEYKWLKNQIYVYPVIGGVEYECLFDTGNSGYLSLKKDKSNAQRKDGDMICEGSWGIAISGVENGGEIIIRNNETVEMGDESFDATVCYVKNTAYNNMGIKFISRFDWYFNKGKMYYKPRNVENVDYQIKSPYRIIATDKGLMVIMKVVDEKNTLNFGDIITAVNGVEITNENICYYNKLLNNTMDWSVLEIGVLAR